MTATAASFVLPARGRAASADELVFEATPIAVGRDFVVYGATRGGERVAVKLGQPGRDQAVIDAALRREHEALVALGRHRRTAAFVPAARGLTVLGDGRLALVMSFVDGVPLATLIERALVRHRYQGARRWTAATRALVASLSDAVGALHAAGWVHNDLKPENVLVRQGAHGLEVVLVDLALAAPEGRGGPGGTVSYAAPERLEGAPGTARSDLWALGAIVYELLAGTRPYPADAPADALAERLHPIDRLPRESAARAWAALPPSVRGALVAALAHDPGDRPRSIARFVKKLDITATARAPHVAPARAPAPASTVAEDGRATTTVARWRAGLGATLVLVGGAVAIGLGLAAARHGGAGPALNMCIDVHGSDACRAALTSPTWSRVLGIPVSLWAAALHATLLAVTGLRLVTRRGDLALLTLVLVLLAGTTTYLVVGLAVMEVRCTLCLAMHGSAFAVGVGGLLLVFDRGRRLPLGEPRAWMATLVALAAWLGLALALGALVSPARARPTAQAGAAPAGQITTAAASACPSAVTHDLLDLPPDASAVVLAEAARDAPVLVAWIDLDCEACRAAHTALAPLYRELVQTRRAGLRLVLGADLQPRHIAARAAPAALVCAARHGGGLAALDLVDWELYASPGFYLPADRRRWLETRLGRDAAHCLDAELVARDGGSLAAHAAWVDDARRAAAARPECVDAAARGAWWCWAGTPSFGVFRPRRGAASAASAPAPDPAGAPLADGLATASEAARRATLAACLEP
ncbi:MAG: protein kinase [Deltaproteobacteria bacterium]|nr:protein kinase [Deltaproteobacteria bacterium]